MEGRKTGGRKAGTPNKRTVHHERVLAQAVEKLAGKAFKGDALAFLRTVYKGTLYPFEARPWMPPRRRCRSRWPSRQGRDELPRRGLCPWSAAPHLRQARRATPELTNSGLARPMLVS